LTQNLIRLHQFQPIGDPRWVEFLRSHPCSSVFHTVEWLDALRRTYAYEPVAFTTCERGEALQNAFLFCRVKSWATGRRLVSLPFSDHCEPLVDANTDLTRITAALVAELPAQRLRYIEFRPTHPLDTLHLQSYSTHSHCLHQIDLKPDLDSLFHRCHKSSTQRKIRRAERESLRYEEGRSTTILNCFYDLLLLTRRRHALPPQPMCWFRNLIDCFGQALKIRIAFRFQQPVAAILTLKHKDTLVYKYGCSNAHFHALGGLHLLFWRSIQEAKEEGLSVFDLGRSDWEDEGLITFKDRWGAQRSLLTYVRLLAKPPKEDLKRLGPDWKERAAKTVFRHLPNPMFRLAGELIYRHIG
jgi:CelD/BcsL family acetyltransferase involved in cellulose biosynthesis